MTPTGRPPIIREHDERGQPVVRVPLDPKGTAWATLDAEDFDSLPPELTRTWFLNGGGKGYEYVGLPPLGGPVQN